ICGAKVSSWSSVTPRSRTTGEKIKWGKSAAMAERSSFASCCRVPNQINWVFDGLSLKRLVDIQVSKTSKVLLIAKTAEVALEAGQCRGPSIKYVTLFLANFYPLPCHTLSHIPGPPQKYVTFCTQNSCFICTIKKCISVTSHALYPPSPCHKLSHLLGPPPPSSVTYFMDGPCHVSYYLSSK